MVSYLQLAHNERHPVSGNAVPVSRELARAVRNFRLRDHLGLDDGAGLEVEEAAQRSG